MLLKGIGGTFERAATVCGVYLIEEETMDNQGGLKVRHFLNHILFTSKEMRGILHFTGFILKANVIINFFQEYLEAHQGIFTNVTSCIWCTKRISGNNNNNNKNCPPTENLYVAQKLWIIHDFLYHFKREIFLLTSENPHTFKWIFWKDNILNRFWHTHKFFSKKYSKDNLKGKAEYFLARYCTL